MIDDLTLAQQTILKALRDNESLRVSVVYYADIFALSSQGLVTFAEIVEEHWRGFEVRRVKPLLNPTAGDKPPVSSLSD